MASVYTSILEITLSGWDLDWALEGDLPSRSSNLQDIDLTVAALMTPTPIRPISAAPNQCTMKGVYTAHPKSQSFVFTCHTLLMSESDVCCLLLGVSLMFSLVFWTFMNAYYVCKCFTICCSCSLEAPSAAVCMRTVWNKAGWQVGTIAFCICHSPYSF